MKPYGVNSFGHDHERRANTYRKRARRDAARVIDCKRQRNADRRALEQLLKDALL